MLRTEAQLYNRRTLIVEAKMFDNIGTLIGVWLTRLETVFVVVSVAGLDRVVAKIML